MKNTINSKILNTLVTTGIVLTLLSLAATPLILTAFFKSALSMTGTNLDLIVAMAIYVCAVPYVAALFDLKKICKLFATDNYFSEKTPMYLKRISIYAFSEVILFNGAAIFLYYFFDVYLYALTIVPCVIISFVSISIGLLCLVLSKLYAVVNEIKDENDQTI